MESSLLNVVGFTLNLHPKVFGVVRCGHSDPLLDKRYHIVTRKVSSHSITLAVSSVEVLSHIPRDLKSFNQRGLFQSQFAHPKPPTAKLVPLNV